MNHGVQILFFIFIFFQTDLSVIYFYAYFLNNMMATQQFLTLQNTGHLLEFFLAAFTWKVSALTLNKYDFTDFTMKITHVVKCFNTLHCYENSKHVLPKYQ
jgi:hypothetical protein